MRSYDLVPLILLILLAHSRLECLGFNITIHFQGINLGDNIHTHHGRPSTVRGQCALFPEGAGESSQDLEKGRELVQRKRTRPIDAL